MKKNFYMYDVDFINKSSKSISITGIKIIDEKQTYYVIKSSRKLLESKTTIGGKLFDAKKIDSVTFPINLQGYMSEHAFIIMYGPKEYISKKQTISILTSRGDVNIKTKIRNYYISSKDFMEKEKHYKK